MISSYPTPGQLAQADRQRWFPSAGARAAPLDLWLADAGLGSFAQQGATLGPSTPGSHPLLPASGSSALVPGLGSPLLAPNGSPGSSAGTAVDLPPGIDSLALPAGLEPARSAGDPALIPPIATPGPITAEDLETARRTGQSIEDMQRFGRAALAYKAAKAATVAAAQRGRMIAGNSSSGTPTTSGPTAAPGGTPNLSAKPQLGVIVSSLLQFEQAMLRAMAREINERCQQQLRTQVHRPLANYEAQLRVLHGSHD